jgi:hypothetical protein
MNFMKDPLVIFFNLLTLEMPYLSKLNTATIEMINDGLRKR